MRLKWAFTSVCFPLFVVCETSANTQRAEKLIKNEIKKRIRIQIKNKQFEQTKTPFLHQQFNKKRLEFLLRLKKRP